nr:methyl-accepting chemotaxis protein [Rhodoferax sp.]
MLISKSVRSARKGWLARAGIRQLLAMGFGLVLLCLAAITGLAYQRLGSTVDQVRASAGLQSRVTEISGEMQTQIDKAQIALLSTVVSSQPDDTAYQLETMGKAFKAYEVATAQLKTAIGEFTALQDLDGTHKAVEAEALSTLTLVNAAAQQMANPDSHARLGSTVTDTITPAFDVWKKALGALEVERKKIFDNEAIAIERSSRTARLSLLVLAAISMVAAVLAAIGISNRVVGPIRGAVAVAELVAQGDLSRPISQNAAGEAGALLASLHSMQEGLRSLVSDVRHASEGIAIASQEIANGNEDLSNRTQDTAAELQHAVSAMQRLTERVGEAVTATRHADQVVGNTRDAAKQGSAAVSNVVHTMNGISRASSKIAEITGVIDGIAFQTNILALNAAVEAARAGEQGRGFAVVASEVRGLAHRSAEAAKEIKALIHNNAEAVAQGTAQIHGTVSAIDQILSGIEELFGIVRGIHAATQSQSGELQQVSDVVGDLEQKTQQNAALVEEAAAAASSLQGETERLQSLTRVFQLAQIPALKLA